MYKYITQNVTCTLYQALSKMRECIMMYYKKNEYDNYYVRA